MISVYRCPTRIPDSSTQEEVKTEMLVKYTYILYILFLSACDLNESFSGLKLNFFFSEVLK